MVHVVWITCYDLSAQQDRASNLNSPIISAEGSYWCDCNGEAYSNMDVEEETIDGVSYCTDVGESLRISKNLAS